MCTSEAADAAIPLVYASEREPGFEDFCSCRTASSTSDSVFESQTNKSRVLFAGVEGMIH